jgi:fatty-acyl-CoA synthase
VSLFGRALSAGAAAKVLAGAGLVRPYPPWTAAALARTLLRWGTGPAGGFACLAIRSPGRIGLVDELGSLTYADIHARSNALAHALADRGVVVGDRVAVLCRNHRGFVEATVAAAKLGADIVYLNTAFAAPQLVDVIEREAPRVLVHDEEFTALLEGAAVEHRLVAWRDSGEPDGLAAVTEGQPTTDLAPPATASRLVILTSGTTGQARGAARSDIGIEAAVALLDRIPLRARGTTHVAAPLFHTWGFAHLALGMLLETTVVLRRHFEPAACLEVTAEHRCDALVVVPVMLQRILALPEVELARHDLAGLRVVAASGSALTGDLATRWMDRFGDHLYNVYGSTEVAYASVARPDDLRAAPTSAGRPPYGTTVRILDDAGKVLPTGKSGRIFVGNRTLFDGYTGGGSKELVDGLMATGDVGRFDAQGRLLVQGRDDEMIVSGGENVFPSVVEHCLATHPGVLDVSVVGIADASFGQRLRAFVVSADPTLTPEALLDWVRQRLARFEVPREVVLVAELPRNATGKVLKRDLPRGP